MVAVNVLEPFNGIIHFLAAQLAVVVCWSMARGSRGACSPAGGGRAARSSVGGTRAVFLSNTPSFVEQLQRELEFVFAFTLRGRLEHQGAIFCQSMCHTRAIEERREVPSISARILDGSQ